jgi:endonuclease V-like protein UPF0215 family
VPARVPPRPHLLGIDDGPFRKHRDRETPLVAVMMEGCDLVEGVAVRSFPVDGDDVTGFLAAWIAELRFRPALRAVVLGGVTIAGLAVVDLPRLARETGLGAIAVGRRDPRDHGVADALRAAGLEARVPELERAPAAEPAGPGLWAACAGIGGADARALLAAARRKSALPEPLRLAHLIAAALVRGASRGRA